MSCIAEHRVSFASACLPVHKYCSIDALNRAHDNFITTFFVDQDIIMALVEALIVGVHIALQLGLGHDWPSGLAFFVRVRCHGLIQGVCAVF